MLGWLYRVLIGRFTSCNHEWEIIREGEMKRLKDGSTKNLIYISKCKHCGELKEDVF